MQYIEVVEAEFLYRPNRFIAHVRLKGVEEVVHVKNTGRCRELLVPGARVILEVAQNPKRRTKYSLIAVYKGGRLINMDSQAPNEVVYEAFQAGLFPEICRPLSARREVQYGQSRFDIGYESPDGQLGYIEVKGVTLEQDGLVLFPDAPTERGTKHVLELEHAANQGIPVTLVFLVQMEDVLYFTLNEVMDKKFAQAVRTAKAAGVQVLAYDTLVRPESMSIGKSVEIRL